MSGYIFEIQIDFYLCNLLLKSSLFWKAVKSPNPIRDQLKDTYFGCIKKWIIFKNAIYINQNYKCRY